MMLIENVCRTPNVSAPIVLTICYMTMSVTATVLQALRDKGYRLFFWVLHQQYGTGEVIKSSELSRLRLFGKVELFSSTAEADARSKKFKAFVASIGDA